MILSNNRQDEVLSRARHRKVQALVHMIGPDEQPLNPGLIIEDGKPQDLTSKTAFQQHAHSWTQEDTCDPLAEKDLGLLAKVVERIAKRTRDINTGQYGFLHAQGRKRLFNSDDLIDRANGFPPYFKLDFHEAGVAESAQTIQQVPFKNLQDFLRHLDTKLRGIGGKLDNVYVTHSAAMSAFDFYQISSARYASGKIHTYGDLMLARAYNMLTDMGLPDTSARALKPN